MGASLDAAVLDKGILMVLLDTILLEIPEAIPPPPSGKWDGEDEEEEDIVADRAPDQLFNLYPNPNTGEFVIDLVAAEEDIAEVAIWSIAGQHILSRNLGIGQNQLQMNVSNGLYLYTVTINGELKWTGKLSISSN